MQKKLFLFLTLLLIVLTFSGCTSKYQIFSRSNEDIIKYKEDIKTNYNELQKSITKFVTTQDEVEIVDEESEKEVSAKLDTARENAEKLIRMNVPNEMVNTHQPYKEQAEKYILALDSFEQYINEIKKNYTLTPSGKKQEADIKKLVDYYSDFNSYFNEAHEILHD